MTENILTFSPRTAPGGFAPEEDKKIYLDRDGNFYVVDHTGARVPITVDLTAYVQKAGDTLTGRLRSGDVDPGNGIGVTNVRFLATEDITEHAHYAFMDASTLAFAGAGSNGHASFACYFNADGSVNGDHHNAFQDRSLKQGDSTFTYWTSIYSCPILEEGTVTNLRNIDLRSPDGTATIDEHVYLRIQGATNRASTTYAIYTDGAAPSRFGGNVKLTGEEPELSLDGYGDTADVRPYIVFNRARGTESSPAATQIDDAVGKLAFHTETAAGGRGVGAIYVRQKSIHTSGNYVRGNIEFWLSGSDLDYSPKMVISSDGDCSVAGQITSTILKARRAIADGSPYVSVGYTDDAYQWAFGMDPASTPGGHKLQLRYYNGSAWQPIAMEIDPATPSKVKFSTLNIANSPTYADDTAAGAGGLSAGDVYKTSAGAVMVKL